MAKPIRPAEVIARMAAHMQATRHARQARNVLNACGHATISVRLDPGRATLIWQTPLARRWLPACFDSVPDVVHPALLDWLVPAADGRDVRPLTLAHGARQRAAPSMNAAGAHGRRRLADRAARSQRCSDGGGHVAGGATGAARERGALLGRQVLPRHGDILGTSPATVKKHLERVYERLGVETRTAAASVAMQRVRELKPT